MENKSCQNVIENLMDAGCEKKEIQKFIDLYEQGNRIEELQFLEKYRAVLLQKIHQENKKLDCLDYLIYIIKNKEKENKT